MQVEVKYVEQDLPSPTWHRGVVERVYGGGKKLDVYFTASKYRARGGVALC